MSHPVFIAVHVGAGNLSRSKESKYRSACANSCRIGMDILKKGGMSSEAAAAAVAFLEVPLSQRLKLLFLTKLAERSKYQRWIRF